MAHPAANLIQYYVEEGIHAHTAPPWSLQVLETTISKGPHALEFTQEMTAFIQGDMQQRIKYGFSILLLEEDTIIMFGDKLRLSCIAAVP